MHVVAGPHRDMLGLILGWKYDNYPGIRTIGDTLTEWPVALGDVPSQTMVDNAAAEYTAVAPPLDRVRARIAAAPGYRAMIAVLIEYLADREGHS